MVVCRIGGFTTASNGLQLFKNVTTGRNRIAPSPLPNRPKKCEKTSARDSCHRSLLLIPGVGLQYQHPSAQPSLATHGRLPGQCPPNPNRHRQSHRVAHPPLAPIIEACIHNPLLMSLTPCAIRIPPKTWTAPSNGGQSPSSGMRFKFCRNTRCAGAARKPRPMREARRAGA
jgi:hypothetical protein